MDLTFYRRKEKMKDKKNKYNYDLYCLGIYQAYLLIIKFGHPLKLSGVNIGDVSPVVYEEMYEMKQERSA